MKKEYNLKKMKRVSRKPLNPKTTKILKTFRIDADLFLWLQKSAEEVGIPYQTLMNSKLRALMKQADTPLKEQIREIVKEELKKAS
ncbi:MAG: CopG family antitoxin [Bdellovibrionia bacterium]